MSTAAVWQDSDAALVAELAALETRLHSTWAQLLSVVAEIDSRGTAATLGYPTTVELVRAIGRVPLGEARARIAAATDVLPGRGLNGAPVPPTLPATAAAVAEHAIGAADVKVIRSILARIPPHLVTTPAPRSKPSWPTTPAPSMPGSSPCWVSGSSPTWIRTVRGPTTPPKPGGTSASGTATVGVSWPDGSTGKPPRSSARR